MNSLVVIGAQWGDEGKGKITDYLTDRADVVVRYQGGNNAGHTVIANNITYKLHLIPSGAVQNKISLIASGVAFDPLWFIEEFNTLKAQGLSIDNLYIDKRAQIIMPYHKTLDVLSEKKLGQNGIGTTLRGIGPCYTDQMKRVGIRVCDLMDERVFKAKLSANLAAVNEEITRIYESEPLDFDEIFTSYSRAAGVIAPHVRDCSLMLDRYIKEGKKVLFEGAQGTLLDINYGTYPYVTSSHPTSAGVCIGAGIGPNAITDILGVAKAYTTRVGHGPFPTELTDETGDYLREKGVEYGTTTGRPRRCGWLDLVILKYAVRINGLTALALTKLDSMGGMGKIKLCVAYRHKGEIIEDFPAELDILEECEPVYEEFEGWDEDISGSTSLADLPPSTQKYIQRIQELTATTVSIASIGPDRDQTIDNGNFFTS
jgi:adenylosuccinate synthase